MPECILTSSGEPSRQLWGRRTCQTATNGVLHNAAELCQDTKRYVASVWRERINRNFIAAAVKAIKN